MERQSGAGRGLAALAVLLFLLCSPLIEAEGGAASLDDTAVVAAYLVSGGRLAPAEPAPANAKERATHERIWAAVRSIVPRSLLDHVGRFELFNTYDTRVDSIETDGYASLDEDGTRFVLGLRLRSARRAFIDADPDAREEYLPTLIHEFGHVLSLDPSQMAAEGQTGGLETDEGRLRQDALLNLFYARFWRPAYPGRGGETGSDEEGAARYDQAPESFVTEYAATGPIEDFAESFASFVLDPSPNGAPKGAPLGAARGISVKAQKLQFFYARSELVALREAFRRGLAGLR